MAPEDIMCLVMNIISVFSCVFVVIVYVFNKELHSFPLELSTYLIGSMALSNGTYFIYGVQNNPPLCQLQGVLVSFFDINSVLWATLLGYTAYQSIKNPNFIEANVKGLRWIFVGITLISSTIFSLLTFFLDTIENLGTPKGFIDYCWISIHHGEDKHSDEHLHHSPAGITLISIYYSIIWIAIVYNAYCIVQLIRIISKTSLEQALKFKYIIRMMLYPIIQIISYTPSTIIDMIQLESIHSEESTIPHWCFLLEIILDSLCGILYACVFAFNQDILKRICCCYNKAEPEEEKDQIMRLDDQSVDDEIELYDHN